MNLLAILAGLASALTNAMATLALRGAAEGRWPITLPLVGLQLSAWYGLAVFFYGLAFLLYAFVLRNFAPQVAYPVIVGVAYLTILVVSAAVFDERFTLLQASGGMIVIFGIAVISWATPQS